METGWIRLFRRVREHPLWPTERSYSKLEAWLDLLLSANHKESSVNLDFRIIPVARGQLLTSQVKLAKRWGWHRETVSKYLQLLKCEQMAAIETSNKTSSGYTPITIQNYDKYQGVNGDETSSLNDGGAAIETSSRAAAERHKQ